jgi:hypothetical protein
MFSVSWGKWVSCGSDSVAVPNFSIQTVDSDFSASRIAREFFGNLFSFALGIGNAARPVRAFLGDPPLIFVTVFGYVVIAHALFLFSDFAFVVLVNPQPAA